MERTDEPILSRLERLDAIMGYLEELRGCSRSWKSSTPSTPSSVTVTTDSSVNSSPKIMEKRYRLMDDVIEETQVKGNLVDRLVQLENKVLKLSLQMEEEIESEKKKEQEKTEKKPKTKGLRRLINSCIGSNQNVKE